MLFFRPIKQGGDIRATESQSIWWWNRQIIITLFKLMRNWNYLYQNISFVFYSWSFLTHKNITLRAKASFIGLPRTKKPTSPSVLWDWRRQNHTRLHLETILNRQEIKWKSKTTGTKWWLFSPLGDLWLSETLNDNINNENWVSDLPSAFFIQSIQASFYSNVYFRMFL